MAKPTKKKSNFRKFFFNGIRPGEWVGSENISNAANVVKDAYSNLNTYDNTKASQKDFAQDMLVNGLNDEDIFHRMKRRRMMAFVYLIFAVISFLYMGFLFLHGSTLAGVQTFTLGIIMLLFTAREHFLFYQLKMRSYKVKFSAWFGSLLRGEW